MTTRFERLIVVLVGLLACLFVVSGAGAQSMRQLVEHYAADEGAIERKYDLRASEQRLERLRRFYRDQLSALEKLDFASLDQPARIDYLLLRNKLNHELKQLEHVQKEQGEAEGLLPFADLIVELESTRRQMKDLDAADAARSLTELRSRIDDARKDIEKKLRTEESKSTLPTAVTASRAARSAEALRGAMKRWYAFYSGYDPEFTWWAKQPYAEADKALEEYSNLLRRKLAGFSEKEGDDDPVIGSPIGRAALLDALEAEMIAYSPEELIEIANREFEWCENEMKRAVSELGVSDWKAALDLVSKKHVKPGDQPKLIRELAEEAIKFIEDRDLVTVPQLAKETWRMEMMSVERQKVNPYFTGGEVISVSYPTDTMSHEDKLMSMRGNNPSFSRATVQHELIPGHHLQIFMADRYNIHRKAFRTAFLVEGWALYWEMLLWDKNFPRNAEDRVGMLFWRSHRCARIIFSLNFHLGKMSAQECVDFLVERVGHERRNATAEVRRSVQGSYGPLYQAAYMLGGLQIRAMRQELVDSGRMTDKAFHDAILKENAIPIAMIRASLSNQPLTKDFKSDWKFYRGLTSKNETVAAANTNTEDGPAESRRRGQQGPSGVYKDRVQPNWFDGGKKFWYRNDLADGAREFVLVSAEKGTRENAFNHDRVATALSKELSREVKSNQLPFDALEISSDGKTVTLLGRERSWKLDLTQYTLEKTDARAPATTSATGPASRPFRRRGEEEVRRSFRSPDGKWEAFVRDHNLYLREREGGKEHQLSKDGSATETYGRDRYREQAVGLSREAPSGSTSTPEVYWSPDSKKVVAMRTRVVPGRTVYLVESAPRDQLQPKLHTMPYLKPGDDLPIQRPKLYDIEALKEIEVSDELFKNPWDIGRPRWDPDSSRFTFMFNQRGHQVLRIVAVNASSGEARPIVEEMSKTFIDYSGKMFYEYYPETAEIIWMSERDGWNHLYLYDAKTGQVKNQITKGEWVVRGVDRVDREKRQIWFRAGGIRSGQDPYFVHYARVNFDGTGLTILTEADGMHSADFSPDRAYFIDTWSRVDHPPVTELRRSSDGSLMCKLEQADVTEWKSGGRRFPEPFTAKARDGTTDIYGVIWRPRDFQPGKKYAVIENIYAGPQSAFVPKAFRSTYNQQRLADRGFIVVQIDGMGTSHRSKAFHDICWKNLDDAGFPDRIAWMKSAAAKHSEMDLTRVGIYGGSAGGQNALGGLLHHADFYKAGFADCGCHDNRMDKIWWNEQWMGWPVAGEYADASNVTHAHKLKGKLMLAVGELDRNVDPASTMQVVNALIRADKDFDFLLIPGAGHGAGSSPYGQRRMTEFFIRHLQGDASGSNGSGSSTAGAN